VARQGGCKTGEAVITGAGRLPAKFVIHTVGPVWQGGGSHEEALLANCYRNSLELARQYSCKSVAFPNISTGIYRFPKEKAAWIAIETIKQFLESVSGHGFESILLVCFDDESFQVMTQTLSRIGLRHQ
jgi:O-acetyl-ADP-ribose deacetylase (regulator of RNase III)